MSSQTKLHGKAIEGAKSIFHKKVMSAYPEKPLGQFAVCHIALNMSAISLPSEILVAAIPSCTADSIYLYSVLFSSGPGESLSCSRHAKNVRSYCYQYIYHELHSTPPYMHLLKAWRRFVAKPYCDISPSAGCHVRVSGPKWSANARRYNWRPAWNEPETEASREAKRIR